MKSLRFFALVCIGVFFIGVGVAQAQQITPVGVTVSSTFRTYDPLQLIDDSGLSGGVHDNNWRNMWMSDSGDTTPWLVFDLGDAYVLAATDVWQYLYSGNTDRGVQGFSILISSDGSTFTPAGTGTLTQGSGATTAVQVVPFSATGRYVRFEVTSNWGDAQFTGLSEVKFEGTVVPVELQSFSVE